MQPAPPKSTALPPGSVDRPTDRGQVRVEDDSRSDA